MWVDANKYTLLTKNLWYVPTYLTYHLDRADSIIGWWHLPIYFSYPQYSVKFEVQDHCSPVSLQ